jgi:hypothetical protein
MAQAHQLGRTHLKTAVMTFNPGWDSNAKNSTVSRTCANYRGFPFVMADRSRE